MVLLRMIESGKQPVKMETVELQKTLKSHLSRGLIDLTSSTAATFSSSEPYPAYTTFMKSYNDLYVKKGKKGKRMSRDTFNNALALLQGGEDPVIRERELEYERYPDELYEPKPRSRGVSPINWQKHILPYSFTIKNTKLADYIEKCIDDKYKRLPGTNRFCQDILDGQCVRSCPENSYRGPDKKCHTMDPFTLVRRRRK